MSRRATMDDLVSLHRDLHRHSEPAWCEFYTTVHLVDELETYNPDILYVGPEISDADKRAATPDDAEFGVWVKRAREAGVRGDIPDRLAGSYTGVIAVVERGEGPTVGLCVDIGVLPVLESEANDHLPATKGFRSENEGSMHARDHNAHAAIGLSTLDVVINSDFERTSKLFFQPSEEQVAGGRAVAEGGYLDDVDYLPALHVSLDHPTSGVVCGIDDFLAVSHLHTEFTGAPAHAGVKPEGGKNANLGATATTQNLYGTSRHSDGAIYINADLTGGGIATNVAAEETFIEGEVRGTMTELMKYTEDRAHTIIESSAAMYSYEIEIDVEGRAPSACSDDVLVAIVGGMSEGTEGVTSIPDHDDLGGSGDMTYLMQHVQGRGGLAAYAGVDADHPGGHHIRTFDVDEETIRIAIDVLVEGADRTATEYP